jgi:glycosyltransferase involved in cell wall biosynthesis
VKASFITWYPHCRRSNSLAVALHGKSHLIHYLRFKRPWQAPFKYLLQTLVTFTRLAKDKPELILVTTPPVLAALPVYVYARTTRVPFVIDAHTGVFDNPRWTWLIGLSRWLSRAAVATIVTNDHLATTVESWGARAVVIGDLPDIFSAPRSVNLGNGVHVAVISTFSDDEPLEAVVEAARWVPNVNLHITGDVKRAPHNLRSNTPPNVRYTGWLTEEEYVGLLRAATAVMALTTRDHTMQRGASEAMALEKPLITSNWPILRQIFSKGTVYVDNTVTSIAAGLMAILCDYKRLASEMSELRYERHAKFQAKLDSLMAVVKDYNLSHHLGSK